MAAFDFNGGGANTSNVRTSTSAAIFGTAPFTMIAMILPDSAGQSNSGCIMSTGTSANANRKRFLLNASLQLRLVVQRNTTSTEFIASNRAVVVTASEPSKAAALVAATFDDAASPKVKLYSSSDGTTNQAAVAETAYGTSTAGAGTVNGEGTNGVLVAGNLPGGAATFAGGMLWQAFVPAVVSLEVLQALASGANPALVLGEIARTRIVWFGQADGTALDLVDPSQAWTVTAVTTIDGPATYGGGGFMPGGAGPALQTTAVEAYAGSGTITAASAVTGSEQTGRAGSGTITATTGITGTRATNRQGTSALTATTAVIGSGSAAKSGTGAAITASSAVTGTGATNGLGIGTIGVLTATSVTGTPGRAGTSSITASTAVTQTVTQNRSGTSTITATTGFTASGTGGIGGAGTITAATGITGTAAAGRTGSGAASNSPLVTGAGTHGSLDDTAVLAATGITGVGSSSRNTNAGIAATATIVVSATTQRAGNSTVSATTAFTVSGNSREAITVVGAVEGRPGVTVGRDTTSSARSLIGSVGHVSSIERG